MSTVTIIRSLLKSHQSNLFAAKENFPMTMQVGMVGSNGVVIAGDQRCTRLPALQANQLWSAGTYGTNSSKIIVNSARGIAVSAARDMDLARAIAKEITEHLPLEKYHDPISWIEDRAHQILGRERRERSDPNARIEAHCLIVVHRPTPKLFRFQFAVVDGEWGPFCEEQTRYAIAGENVNAAIFWPEAYYNTYPYARKRVSVKNLIPLAAYTVILAHRFNAVWVSGLEVVFCDEMGLHRLSRESIDNLQEAATEWDKKFGETILGYSQDFTFDPSEPE